MKQEEIINLQQSALNEFARKFNEHKESVIKERLKELLNIDFDANQEQERRFPRFTSEHKGDEETIYFNDGSVDGVRLVTFITKGPELRLDDMRSFTMGLDFTYY